MACTLLLAWYNQKTKPEIIQRERINLSTNITHGDLKPVLAALFSLLISGHQWESSLLGHGRTLRQGQTASSDQPSTTNALLTQLIIQQHRGYILFEPAGALHIKSVLTSLHCFLFEQPPLKIEYSGSFSSLELSCEPAGLLHLGAGAPCIIQYVIRSALLCNINVSSHVSSHQSDYDACKTSKVTVAATTPQYMK